MLMRVADADCYGSSAATVLLLLLLPVLLLLPSLLAPKRVLLDQAGLNACSCISVSLGDGHETHMPCA